MLIAFSAYKAVKKLSRIGPAAGMLDDVLPDGSYRKIATETAEDVNAEFAKANYAPPYKPGTKTVVIELTQATTFVRVYNKTNSGQIGGWIMKYGDIAGLTPEQIQNKFSLPDPPTHITDVVLDAGTRIRGGIANDLWGFDGEGLQFDLMQQWIGRFTNERPLK